jgi:hypothetical protein
MTKTAQVMQAMQALHSTQMDAIGKAAVDAVKYGTGVMIMNTDMSLRHVPVDEYLDLCQFMQFLVGNEKPTSG